MFLYIKTNRFNTDAPSRRRVNKYFAPTGSLIDNAHCVALRRIADRIGGRSTRSLNSTARILGTVSSENRGEQVAKTFFEFLATGRVVHFDALAFATDQAGFAQDFEMLGEGRLG